MGSAHNCDDRAGGVAARPEDLAPGHPRLVDLAAHGQAPTVFAKSEDPERLVPIVAEPEDIMIAVSGDPLRTNAYVFAHNGILGYPTTRTIRLPAGWSGRHREARRRH